MTSMILRGQVPGFVVEGEELPITHPQHPSQKTSALFKALKGIVEHRSGKRPGHYRMKRMPKIGNGKTITIDSTIKTRAGEP
jgi:hypothetical protein